MNIKERIKKFIEHKDLPVSKFEEACGLSNGYIASMRVGFGKDKLNNVLTAFPDLNRDWLLYGEGEMINKPQSSTVLVQTVEEIKAEAIEEIKAEESVPIVPSDIANTAEINVRKFIEKRGDELERISPNDLVQRADGAERVRKTSMMPTFMPGDIVFIEFLDDKTKIIDGHIYYFDTKTRPTMIRRVKFEGNKLRLIAENPMFGDIITSFDEILNIADIVGMFRSSFGNQYIEIEEVRKKKDSQIDKLIEHIGDLIAVVKNKS